MLYNNCDILTYDLLITSPTLYDVYSPGNAHVYSRSNSNNQWESHPVTWLRGSRLSRVVLGMTFVWEACTALRNNKQNVDA